ncbi:MAG TPA: ATP-binding cassette domain-containing protein [Burkholderiales bacterium]|nr:ATP-binding cassette domain-containing protein [Burkholderiales bacterium]
MTTDRVALDGPADITLRARELSRTFGATQAVIDLDLELRRGEVLGLLGPNGAGKTTTMQMLTGNLAPSKGSISICGIDLLDRPVAAKSRLGYLPEAPPLYKELKVDEYLRLAARLHRVVRDRLAETVANAKRRCGLMDMGHRVIGTLSKGYQQRVGIAQAIIHTPDVVILDEPTVGLDPNQIREIRALVRELSDSHSVILSTHILPEVEAVCDRVQILHRGRMVYNDTIDDLRRHRGTPALKVAFRNPPAVDKLSAISGVASVVHADDGSFRIERSASQDPTDALVRASVDHDWRLTHLAVERATLEDVFVQLTQRESDALGASKASEEALR